MILALNSSNKQTLMKIKCYAFSSLEIKIRAWTSWLKSLRLFLAWTQKKNIITQKHNVQINDYGEKWAWLGKNELENEPRKVSLTQKKSELENEPRKWAPICRILLFYINSRWWRIIPFFYLLVDTQLLCQPISSVLVCKTNLMFQMKFM